jgi:cell division protein FtsB
LAGVLALAVFPAQAYLDQRHEHRALAAQAAKLDAENQALADRTAQLGTDAEIERLARDYNLVKPGEEVYFVPPQAGPTTTTPAPAAAPHPSKSLWRRITSIF